MSRIAFWAICLAFTGVLPGCGKPETTRTPTTQSTPAEAAASDSTATEEVVVQVPTDLNPKETVANYLKAVKEGDKQIVAALLTEVARQKTEEANIAVAPPGSDAATYTVGDMEFVTADKKTAHVASVWTDSDEEGKPQTLRIVWVVRQDTAGWRIAGMITRLSPKEPMLVLDFEKPEEVIQRSQAEIARRRAAGAQATAQTPPPDGQPVDGMAPSNALREAPRQARGPQENDPSAPR